MAQGAPARQRRKARRQREARQGIQGQAEKARRKTRGGEKVREMDLPGIGLDGGFVIEGALAASSREEGRSQEGRGKREGRIQARGAKAGRQTGRCEEGREVTGHPLSPLSPLVLP